MIYCPICGKKLNKEIIEHKNVMVCSCGFIDWNNAVNISAVAVCYNDHHDILMVKMKRTHQGKWTFPGGYRELYETIEEACIRECVEETGLEIDQLSLYKVYTKDDDRLVWIVYKAHVKSGHFTPNSEVSEIKFFRLNDMPTSDQLRGPLTIKLIEDLMSEV